MSPSDKNDSDITFGEYKSEHFDRNYDLVTHQVSGSFHWSLHIVSFELSGKRYLTHANSALTDTGSTSLLMPAGNYCYLISF